MKKSSIKNLSLGLAAFLSLGGLIGIASNFDGLATPVLALSGEGTAESPYQIGTLADLQSFRSVVNSTNQAACAELTADIVMSGTNNWTTTIGDIDHPYTGTFDGKGHSITGLSISTQDVSNRGLFGVVGDATIKNLTASVSISITMTGNYPYPENNAGIAGYVTGAATFENVTLGGTVASAYRKVGGIAGWVNGSATFLNCTNNASVSNSKEYSYIGGIAGQVQSTGVSFLYCTNNRQISGGISVGGIMGNGSASSTSGRLVGCVNSGTINANNYENSTQTYSGGIAGDLGGSWEFSKCYNTGSVSSTKHFGLGGVVGRIYLASSGTVSDLYNAGAVSCTLSNDSNEDKFSVGGIAGTANNVTFERCYNLGGLTSGYTKGAILGLSKNKTVAFSDCYYRSNCGGGSGRGGSTGSEALPSTGLYYLTEAQFADESKFNVGWKGDETHVRHFDQNPWTLRSGTDSHPILGIHKLTFDKQGGDGGTDGSFYNKCHAGFFTTEACDVAFSTPISVPSKAGHDFLGYYTGLEGTGTKCFDETGALLIHDSFLTESGSLYAYWLPVTSEVAITAGSGIKSVYIAETEDATSGSASGTAFLVDKTVYGFVELDKGYSAPEGWVLVDGTAGTEGAKYRVTNGVTVGESDIDLGTFNADLITYSISYELDGGSVATANPTTYTIESDAITLTNPTKEHCEFAGWTGTDLATPTMSVTIPSGSIGDREYTAHWTPMIAVLETSGTQHVYDGNAHSITGIRFKNALTNEEIDCDVKFSDDEGSTYTLDDAPSFSEIGEHTIYYRASKDGYVTLDGTIALTISKAPLVFTAPKAVDGLIYDGNDHALITAGSANVGDVLYAANTSGALPEETSFSSAIPTGNAATTYYVFYKATGDAHYAEIPASLENKVTVTIQKLESTMTAPTPKLGLVYTGEAQDLVTAGSTNAGEMQYAVNTTGELPDAGDFSAAIPTGTAPATYHVFYRTTGDATHDAIPASSDNKVTVTITKLQSTLEAPKAKLGLIYDGTAQDLVTAGSTNAGEMLYAANTSGELPNDASFSSTIPTGTAAATYYVFYKATGDLTHDAIAASLENKVTVVIAAAETTYEAPKAKVGLLYTGESQELIAAGSTEAGEMLYAVNTVDELPAEGDFSAAIPTGKSVGTYYVFFKTTGDENHAPIASSLDNKVTVTIAKVDRSEAEKANKEASDYLDTLKNDSKFADIVSTLEGARNKLVAEAITADDVTEAEVAASVAVLRDAIEAAKVSVVEVLIDAIGNLSYDGGKNDSLKDINAAKAAYDALTDAQKAKVASAKVTTLNHDIEVYSHVDPVGKMIAALPTPASEQSYYDAVDAAKAAYDALTAEEKALLDASFGYKKILEDNVAAKEVIMTISEIGEVSYDEISEEKINAAREAYESLSEEVKAKIDPKILGVLTNAEKEYSSLANYNKIAAITLTFVSGAAFLCGFLWLLLVPLRKKDDDDEDDDVNSKPKKKAKAA